MNRFNKFTGNTLSDMASCVGGRKYKSKLASGQKDIYDPSTGNKKADCDNPDVECLSVNKGMSSHISVSKRPRKTLAAFASV